MSMALRTNSSQRSFRLNHGTEAQEGEWIEHKVGTGLSLVRSPTFRSPAGFRRQYSSYLIRPQSTGLETTLEDVQQVLAAESKTARPQSQSSGRHAVKSRPQSSLRDHRPARRQPLNRPKSSVPHSIGPESPGCSPWEIPRPKTTDCAISQNTLNKAEAQTQSMEKMGNLRSSYRKDHGDPKTKRPSHALPTRVPLQPMSDVPSDSETEETVLQLGIGDEGLRSKTSADKANNKVRSLRFVKPDPVGPLTTNSLRYRTSLRYLADEPATASHGDDSFTPEDLNRDPNHAHHHETVHTAAKEAATRKPMAYQRLKSLKWGKAEKRFWNNDAFNRHDSPMAASTVLMVGGNMKKLQNRATIKVHDENEFIKAMLYKAGREEPVHKNAEGWLSGVDSLLDKRAKLRMFEAMQYDAHQGIRQAQVDISTTSNLIGLQKEKGEKKDEEGESVEELEKRLETAHKQQAQHERQLRIARSWADSSAISVEELDAVKPGTETSSGGNIWHTLKEEIGNQFVDQEAKENMFRRVQNALDDHRKGWWREEFPTGEDTLGLSSGSDEDEPVEEKDFASVLFKIHSGAQMEARQSPPSPALKAKEPEMPDPWRADLHRDPVWTRKSRDEELRLEALILSRPFLTPEEEEADIALRKKQRKKLLAREQRELQERRHQTKQAKLNLWPTEHILKGMSNGAQLHQDTAPTQNADKAMHDDDKPQAQEEATTTRATSADSEEGGEVGDEEAAAARASEKAAIEELHEEEQDRKTLKTLIARSKQASVRFELAKALRYPGLVKALHTWYDKYLEAERLRRGQVKAYERMCTGLQLPAIGLGTLERFVYDKDTDTLKIPGFNLSPSHMTVLCSLFKGEDLSGEDDRLMPTLKLREALGYCQVHHINCANNSIRGQGMHQLVKAIEAGPIHLLTLDVSFNGLGEEGAQAIANLLGSSAGLALQELDVSRNVLGDFGVAKIAGAIAKLRNPALKKLSVSRNEGAYHAGCALGHMLDKNSSLEELDASWNQLKGDAAVMFADGLQHNTTLKTLLLQWNAVGDSKSAGAIAKALHHAKLEFLDLSENRMGAPGAFLLAEGLEANSSLREVCLNGNPLTMQGAREVLRASSAARQRVEGVLERKLRLDNCGVGIIAPTVFDPAEPAGLYQLDMADPMNHRVMKNLIKLTKHRKGQFDRRTAIVSAIGDGAMTIKKMFRLEFTSDDPEEWILPEEGLLEFNFSDKRKPATEHSLLSPEMMGVLIEQLQTADTPSTKKVDYVHATVGASYMSYEQLVELLSYIPHNDTVERVNLVSRCFHRLANVDDPRKALNLLVGEERGMAEKQLGNASFAFFKNNATGFHRLDLSKHAHRDVAVRLVELYNAMDSVRVDIEKYYDGRAGGKRDISGIGLIWRNAKLDGVPFTFTSHWHAPYGGTLEVDFIDIRRPPPTAEAMSTQTFQEMVLDKWDRKSELLGLDIMSGTNKLRVLREASNQHYFSCTQVARLLSRFRSAKEANVRIEIVVTCWSRTVDWHGLANILQILTPFEYRVLVHRLGYINVFDEMMAVGFWDLDLAVSGERFVFQELYHLAVQEPGQSIVNPTMNAVDTVIPDTWVTGGMPEHGKVTLFFVRTADTLERVMKFGAIDHEDRIPAQTSISTFIERYLEEFCQPGCNSPAGCDWIHPYRCRRIRRKLMEKFDRPQACFRALDKDGSGALSRTEISVGLVAVGIWLHPNELEQLLQELDKDGSGSVEVAELIEFWDKFSPQALL